MARAVISTIGRDRPGVVNEVSEAVFANGVSIEDSRMTVLGGEFAVLMSVVGDDQDLDNLESALAGIAAHQEMAYLFRRTHDRSAVRSLPYEVRVVAMDHPGIVHGIANFFSVRNINIRDLETETERAPHTGTPIFNLSLTIEVPPDTKIAQLRKEFSSFCKSRDLDGSMSAPA